MSSEYTNDNQSRREIAIYWTRGYPMVSAYVRSMIHSLHDAEDVIQEVAVAVAENFEQFDPSKQLMPWIMGIARHKVVDHIRAKGSSRQSFNDHTMLQISEAFESIESESDDMKKALEECMGRLKDRPRHVLELRYLREMDISAVSERMGLSSNAIYVMLHRIRTSLAQCIQGKTQIGWEIS
jgi:RNA polymerase sigma-70 factor, ECF subfamily